MMSTIQPKIDEPVSDELALVQAAKGGDVGAFEELVRRYDRNVFRIAQHITQNREVADGSPKPEQQHNQAEGRAILTRSIQGLPASFRTVCVLRDAEGLSTQET